MPLIRMSSRRRLGATVAAACLVVASVIGPGAEASAAPTPAPGFSVSQVATVAGATALAALPNGDVVVSSRTGPVYLFENGALRATPILDLTSRTCSNNERGVIGLAADPDPTTRALYVFYTAKGAAPTCPTNANGSLVPAGAPVNRVSRFTMAANGTVDPASETILLDRIYSSAAYHNGGDLFVASDGNLYVTTGDGGCDYRGGISSPGGSGCGGANDASRDMNILNGKVLRITRSGGIPADNPYVSASTQRCNAGPAPAGVVCREIFASGLRNPFRFAFDPNASTPVFRVNDVGQDVWEEIDQGIKGADYGWNLREGGCALTGSEASCGPATPANLTDPIYSYAHSTGCRSITGAAYVPNGMWPPSFDGSYLFADYVCGKIRSLAPSGAVADVVTGLGTSSAVAMAFAGPESARALFFTSYAGGGALMKLTYTGTANRVPAAVLKATPSSGTSPLRVTLSGAGSSDPDGDTLTYIWTYGDGTAQRSSSASTAIHTYPRGTWTATLKVKDAKGAWSAPARVVISSGNIAPKPTIVSPVVGATFVAGKAYTLSGKAMDAEDGAVPGTRLSWTIQRRHDQHTHPFLGPVTGATASFVAPGPEDLAAAANSDLLIRLTATDSKGLSTTTSRAFTPQRVPVTFTTQPTGRVITVNGAPHTAPFTVTSWAGSALQVEVPTQTDATGTAFEFGSWSDGGAAVRTITTPAAAKTYTATLIPRRAPPSVPQNAAASQTGEGAATLTWSPPASSGDAPITGYRVSRDGVDADGRGAWTAVISATRTSFVFTRLVPDRAYTLSVQAVSSIATGAAASVSITTHDPD